ncbi:MAG: ABC transporter ATP-binding protein [Saprospiraceae bacterium]|nr:ABC transporter ATP-binding protein [Bacteroidia bacterium]NNE15687.1 ABC transporter ATP-binding protein [Saprospiraceae bacterium]NNL93586.1 ABC transporter ATP-binding protein [Saprospiraceae bacterium]
MIKFENLYKSFGKNDVLKGIDIHFDHQGITAILGPNGSGKTTLIKCLLGLVLPDSGEIFFDKEKTLNQFEYRHHIAHLPQIARFPENLTALEIIDMITDLREGATRVEELIEMFDLKKELNKKMGTLSGGNRQKVNLLIALMYDTPAIILDEPSTGLDPVAIINLKQFLREEKAKGKLILITTHMMSFVEEMADNIAFLLEGKIYFDASLQQILADHNETNLERAIAKILHADLKKEVHV